MTQNPIIRAAQFAEQAHRGQVRKYTGTPYIWHPMRVAGRVALEPDPFDHDAHERLVVIAWLHDVLEDTSVTVDQLAKEFGPTTALGVAMLTNPSKKHPELSRADRKKMDRDHLRNVPTWSRFVKLLDRIDNLREMTDTDPDFLKLYREESLLLLNALVGTHAQLEAELGNLARAR